MIRRTLVLLLTALTAVALAADLGGRIVTVGTDSTYPPFEFVAEDGTIVGFDVDLVNAICERINCVAEFQSTAWDGIIPALAAGEFDMIASGMSITAERAQVIEFSDPYHVVTQAVAVRVEDAGVAFDELVADGGTTVGAQTGTTNAYFAEEAFGRDRLNLYDTFAQAVQALLNGDVRGVVIDEVPADAFAAEYAGQLVVDIRGLGEDPLGMAFQIGSDLVDAFNEGLAEIAADGTLDALKLKWFVTGD
ncbi:MAG: basic amino acid ABC transporter substrate-binding protein [Trueperaceae bacterium]|nr:basic amino acid ABC transporter substrate-binding protein [Trueperaceae bacterium]